MKNACLLVQAGDVYTTRIFEKFQAEYEEYQNTCIKDLKGGLYAKDKEMLPKKKRERSHENLVQSSSQQATIQGTQSKQVDNGTQHQVTFKGHNQANFTTSFGHLMSK
ncbi:hypothetical protein QL285_084400 [Trifolium repens]|nr:hypothetical protein QL285_084400 [Trifolium repens]